MRIKKSPKVVVFDEYLDEREWISLFVYTQVNEKNFEPMPRDFPLRWERKHSKEFSKDYLVNKIITDQKLEMLMSGEQEEGDILPSEALGFYKDMSSPPWVTEILWSMFDSVKNDIMSVWGVDTYHEGIHAITAIPDGVSMNSHVDGYLLGNHKPSDFSSIYYINDDFDGGEVVFENIGLSFKPIKNSLIVFSNSHSEKMIHSVNTVKNGTRYMSQCFFTTQEI